MDSLVFVFLCLVSSGAAQQNSTVWWSPMKVRSPSEGFEVIEGDILVPINLTKNRNAIANEDFLWKDGIIPYKFKEDYTPEEKTMVQKAMKYLEEKTCIRFVKEEQETTVAGFQKEPIGCSSAIGTNKLYTKEWLPINLQAPGCFSEGIILHELLHVTGLYHEHSRPDRDEYVDIHWTNIIKDHERSFLKINDTITFDLPYGFDSIMHYDKYSFSANGEPTITAKSDPNMTLGQKVKPTENDIEKVNRMYKCKK